MVASGIDNEYDENDGEEEIEEGDIPAPKDSVPGLEVALKNSTHPLEALSSLESADEDK